MTSVNGIAIVQSLYQALGTFDVAAIARLVAPDVEWSVSAPSGALPWAGVHRGPEGVIAYLSALGQSLQFEDFAITGLFGDGQRVVATGRDRGTARRSGRPYATDFAHVFELDAAGRITSFRALVDSAGLAAALAA